MNVTFLFYRDMLILLYFFEDIELINLNSL
jgi:hypothetical protein